MRREGGAAPGRCHFGFTAATAELGRDAGMMSVAPRAVFLSYASQDADAARRICEALRSGGVEVWFDADGGLEHGDEWDAKIRRQIKECVLFIPIISASTQARHEGYFRIEWDLAAERARGIASGVPFILPVVIDDTREPDALVPDRFRAVQWTRLRAGEVSPEVLQRLLKLWSHRTGVLKHEAQAGQVLSRQSGATATDPAGLDDGRVQRTTSRRFSPATWSVVALVGLAAVALVWQRRPAAPPPPDAAKSATPAPSVANAPSEARKLIAQARLQLAKPEMARIELSAADGFCRRAAELDEGDAEVWATWSQVNTWYVYYNFEHTLARREAARDYAARAMRLAPRSFEARLAQACYWVRGEGLVVGFVAGEKDKPVLYNEAERLLRELHAEDPDEPRVLLALGFIKVWKDPPAPDRFDLLERVTRNSHFAAEAWKEIGWIKWFQGDPVAGLVAADRSIALHPTWNNLWLKTWLAAVWLGDLDLAKATLESMPGAALQEDGGLYMMYWVYAWRNEPLKALALLERQPREWLRMSGYVGPKALLVGKLRRLANQPELARRDFLRARELVDHELARESNNRDLLSLQAQALHFLGESDEARRTYRLARDLGARGPELDVLFESPDAIFDSANAYLKWLEHRPNLWWYFTAAAWRLNPDYAALREHPRYSALLARLDADPRFAPGAKTSAPKITPTTPDPKSIAVLAFDNRSDDKDTEYFSDGISEELINTLGRVAGLVVKGRTSAFFFKGRNASAQEIGEKLNVALLVRGSVRKSGSTVRITAQLSRASTDEVLWSSEPITRELKDVFAVQDEIARLIAESLSLKLGTNPKAARSVNPEAFQSFLAGRAQAEKADGVSLRAAAESFRRAGELEPNFAAAWVQLAWVNVQLARWGGLPQMVGLERARQAIARAVALEPDSPDVLLALGWVRRTADWDWRGADQAFRRALELRPTHPQTLADAAVMSCNLGRMEEALQLAQRAVDLDPLNAASHLNLSQLFRQAGELTRSEQAIRRALQLAPQGQRYHTNLARLLTETGRVDEAEREVAQETDEIGRLFSTALVHIARGRNAEALAAVHALEAQDKLHPGTADIFTYSAYIHARLGDFDRAFASLERARAAHDTGIPWIKTSYDLRPLHHDPRWPKFLRSVGLADEQLR